MTILAPRLVGPALAVLSLAALPALADHMAPMASDGPLNMALQEMLGTFGNACQTMGDPNACGAFNYVQQAANYMVGADAACYGGDPMACQAYEMAYRDIEGTYAGFSQMMGGSMGMAPAGDMTGGGMTGGVNPLGETHADRMGAIAQFGADNTAAFNDRMATMDVNQSQFLGTLGN